MATIGWYILFLLSNDSAGQIWSNSWYQRVSTVSSSFYLWLGRRRLSFMFLAMRDINQSLLAVIYLWRKTGRSGKVSIWNHASFPFFYSLSFSLFFSLRSIILSFSFLFLVALHFTSIMNSVLKYVGCMVMVWLFGSIQYLFSCPGRFHITPYSTLYIPFVPVTLLQ